MATPDQIKEDEWFCYVLVESLRYSRGTIKRLISDESAKNLLSEFLSQTNHHTIIYCSDSEEQVEWMRQKITERPETKSKKENYHFMTLDEMESARYKGSDPLIIVDLYHHHHNHEVNLIDYQCLIRIYPSH